MSEINVTPFDNEISILYKWARNFKAPVKLIIADKNIKEDKEVTIYTNGIKIIQELSSQGKSLRQIYNQLVDKLDPEDITMVYTLSKSQTQSLDQILTEINVLYETINIDLIENTDELTLVLSEWRLELSKDLQNDMDDLEDIETIHNELNKYNEILYSPIKVDKVTIKASPTLISTSQKPSTADGLVLFDQTKPSYNIPYIRYNGSDGGREELFKLYQGQTDETMPDYKVIIPPTSQTNKDNSLYMTVWTGKGNVVTATKESYIKGSYDLTNNLLTIKTPAGEESTKEIITKIEKGLPIKVNNYVETGVSGEFYLFDLEINDIYLVHSVINHELMNSYLFVKETNTPYAEKTQLKLYYKSYTGVAEEEENVNEGYIVNPASVAVSLTQNYSQGGEIILAQTAEGVQKFKLNPNTPYVKAKITQAESLEVANQFVKIFSRLMQYYKTQINEIDRLFTTYIPEIKQQITEETKKEVSKRVGKKRVGSNIEILKEAAPDLFVKGYARKCQRSFQPVIVPPEEIDAWRKKTFLYKNVQRERQVMPFPPDNPRWNFACPSDTAPFPGVNIPKNLSNKDTYPCVPCCFKDDQMDPTAKSKYNECYRTKKKEEKVVKETHKIKTGKILGVGRYGYISKSIAEIILKYSELSNDIVRMGVPHTVNSLLHCVSIAIRDPNYLSLETSEQKEVYVSNIRNAIYAQVLPTLMKQELYDFSDEEIMSQLGDPDIFLDPNLFYRAVEQAYNINIYVFSPPLKDDPSSLGSFELPRFKLFHARSPRPEKRAVLIYRSTGSESDALSYPHCEIIIDRDEINNKNIYNFGENMNNLLHEALMTINKTITWDIVKPVEQRQTTDIIARSNIYSRINYYYLFNKSPTHQIIDGYGKTRGYTFSTEDGNTITTILPSTQPENIPSGEIIRSEGNKVIDIFGPPIATTVNKDKLVDGFWYQILDLEHGMYVPIEPTTQYKDLPVGPRDPLVVEGVDTVDRIRKLKRDLDTILQIIKWLFLLSGEDNINTFFERFVVSGENNNGNIKKDSSKIYDLTNVGIKLPQVSTVEEGIMEMSKRSPTLFQNNKVYLYSEKFKEGVMYYLYKYNKERKPRVPVVSEIIYRKDLTEEDFISQPRVAIFTEEGDMRTWLNTLDKLSFKNIIIENKLNIGNSLRAEPYLYASPTGNIYLIQNVIGGDRLKSINVCYNWYLYKINLGHKAPVYEGEQLPVYVVYKISAALAPILNENHAGTSENYLQLLNYGSEQYAAMLPLL